MGFRFQKRISLIPGLRLNLSKSGVSMSVGGRGLTTNLSSSGLRTTIGIPGSGLSYRTKPLGHTGRKKKAEKPKEEKPPAVKTERRELPKYKPAESTDTGTPKADFGDTVNGIAALLNGISAALFFFTNLINFFGSIAPKKPEPQELPDAPIIDVDAETQPTEYPLDAPAPINADPGRYPQTDEECARLGLEKPENWEWRLVLQLMKIRFEVLKKDWEDATWGRRPIRTVTGFRQPAAWSDYMLNQIQEIGDRLKNAYGNEERITQAFGPSGQPGNPEQIILWMNGVCGELAACVDWELEIQTLKHYPDGTELLPTMTGWTATLLTPFYDLCAQMHQKLETAGQSQELDMSIQLQAPQVERFTEVIRRLKADPWQPTEQQS